jgi:hypothetical protein
METRMETKVQALDKKYFNSTENYTLALLNAFDNLWWYVQEVKDGKYITDKAYKVPITFGNYEKANILEDLNEKDFTSGNFNFLPRMVLTFNGMIKAFDRKTQKYQRFNRKVQHPEDGSITMEVSYNSMPYDFQFTLLLQTRGLSSATQLTEQILGYFNPSMNLNIQEFPIFSEMTQTQILIDDPEFEIIDEFEETDVNIVNVTFNLTLRGNIYSGIGFHAPLKTINIFEHIWDEFNINQSKLATYYKLDISPETGKVIRETQRTFNATTPYSDDVLLPEEELIEKRPDYVPPEIITEIPETED